MLTDILLDLYERDLNKLKSEIEQYADEEDLWKSAAEIPNSAGNLCQHLVGNLNHFIGAILGDSGYVRDRDSEFADRKMTRSELLAEVDSTLAVLKQTLGKLDDDDVAKAYPIEVFDRPMSTAYFLTHLATHFNYHLGQINYHRRLLS
jgi:uncharacterized damage-inducible protein DinB